METDKVVGALLYNKEGKIFLMTSPKWNAYVVPGGHVEESESEKEALRREIREELGIEISNIEKAMEHIKEPSEDFHDTSTRFHFIDFFAKADSCNIKPNKEVSKYNWFDIDEALKLPLVDSTKQLVKKFKEYFG